MTKIKEHFMKFPPQRAVAMLTEDMDACRASEGEETSKQLSGDRRCRERARTPECHHLSGSAAEQYVV